MITIVRAESGMLGEIDPREAPRRDEAGDQALQQI